MLKPNSYKKLGVEYIGEETYIDGDGKTHHLKNAIAIKLKKNVSLENQIICALNLYENIDKFEQKRGNNK